jgi:Carboxypeptidase regulatory-like domain/TonB-dependent Receptor Plug Domain
MWEEHVMRPFRFVCALAFVVLSSALALAQGTANSSLAGVVVDTAGGVVPGATVTVRNSSTGSTFETVSNTAGAFSIPVLDPGTYTLTVALDGFKTAVISDVRLLAATPGSVRATLEVGNLEETVEVKGGTELVQTQSATVSSTITTEQITNLPLVSRNALNFVVFLPGVETPGGPRGSTISGLPQNTISVTFDGVNVNNNFQSGDGFFSMVTPRLDAVEEVTVTGATPTADQAALGAVQVAFVTRSGTNNLNGSIYHYFRHPDLNSNYYFNKIRGLERNEVIVHQYGGRLGGPIVIPGLFNGRNRAFFFFNMEEFYQPTEASRTRTILHPRAQDGWFRYIVTVGGVQQVREINLFTVAQQNGQVSVADPITGGLLAGIRSAAGTTGAITDLTNPNTQQYFYQSAGTNRQHAPTGRVDIDLSSRHRLSGSYSWGRLVTNPDILNNNDAPFPGFPNFGRSPSYRTVGSTSLRSTLSSTLVNEVRGGWQWSPLEFSPNLTRSMFDEQGGVGWNFGNNGANMFGLTSPGNLTGLESRNTTNWNVDNVLSWLRGSHSLSLGSSFMQVNHARTVWSSAPQITLGTDTNFDPAAAMFSTTNFPGASTQNLTDARALYGLLTGRITALNGTARLSEETNRYEYLGPRTERVRMNEIGLFAQDTWRFTPTLTLNYGLRWELQLPMQPLNNSFSMSTFADLCGRSGLGDGPDGRGCNFFSPGTLTGTTPQYVQYDSGNPGYDTDWDNFAPNVGAAWRPNVQDGWLRRVLGDPDQATIRGGFSLAFIRERMDRFTNLYSANPGAAINANRSGNQSNLVLPGESWPITLSQQNRLGPPPIPESPAYPLAPSLVNGDDINIFDPSIRVPYTRSWSIGVQRAISDDMAIDVRYVGTRLVNGWTTENWNEINVFENGFLEEFARAQANLRAHVESGCGTAANACSFAYRGPGTGTSPLPTYLAYFARIPGSRAGDPASYAGVTQFSNSAWTGHLGAYEPDPVDAGNDLHANASFRANAIAAGLAANLFVLNPDVDQANITRDAAKTKYDALQIDFRRRLSRGLTASANYTYANTYEVDLDTVRRDRALILADDGVPHAFKTTWYYEVPVGRGKRFGSDINPWLNGLIGDWEFSGTGRLQVRDFRIDDASRLVGMTEDELKKAFKVHQVRDAAGALLVWSLPQDIIDNTRRAWNTDPTSPTGYSADGIPTGRYIAPASAPGCVAVYQGDCATPHNLYVRGPIFTRFDFSFKKRFPFGRGASFDLQLDLLNVLDNVNFNPTFDATPAANTTAFQITSGYTDINTTFDPGGRIGQIVWRLNW